MEYRAEFEFFKKLLENFHLTYTVITPDTEQLPDGCTGVCRLLEKKGDHMDDFRKEQDRYEDNVVYRISSACMYRYLLFRLPEPGRKGKDLFLIGPYMLTEVTKKMIYDVAEYLSFPEKHYRRLEQFFVGLPRIYDESVLLSIVNTFGERIWGSIDNFELQDINSGISLDVEAEAGSREDGGEGESQQMMQILAERYEVENRLIQAVAKGQTHRAEALLSGSGHWLELRTPDRLRNVKNYLIIMNTLLRKAVESADVHPIHIDELSSRFAHKIEQLNSEKGMSLLAKEMVRKYCLLVTNHSMKDYSLLVRKVLTQIDMDLTADLSLKAQAAELGVNASYLSTLFKKETGKTLTEYVNGKRIEQAVFLLNSTRLQVQTIAQHCGISDVNYFTRLFKATLGKTPKEYRDSIAI